MLYLLAIPTSLDGRGDCEKLGDFLMYPIIVAVPCHHHKVLELAIIEMWEARLINSNIQFGFNPNHSTACYVFVSSSRDCRVNLNAPN